MVIGAPRSGTAWASNWLTTDTVECLHDPLWDYHYRDLDAITIPLKSVAIACTGMGYFADWANRHQCPKVILHRPKHEIDASLEELGLPPCPERLIHGLWRLEGKHVRWTELFDYSSAFAIHEWLGLGALDVRRWKYLKDMRVTAIHNNRRQDPAVMERLLRDHHEALA
jgi:hypothetical protein